MKKFFILALLFGLLFSGTLIFHSDNIASNIAPHVHDPGGGGGGGGL